MASADHTTFTRALTSRVQRIKRQPAIYKARLTPEQLQRKLHVRQIKLSGVILAGSVFCALAYLMGLVIGTQL